jgi:tetratricopeptide (TPR) repeat protein
MPVKKNRTEIPPELAAEILFRSDRKCCVCHKIGVQIHHIDNNPANHAFENLAVLCLNCHNETLIQGGFQRKLDAKQIILFRDSWLAQVSKMRDDSSIYSRDRLESNENFSVTANNPTVHKHSDLATYIGKGSMLRALKRYEEALNAYNFSSQLDPSYALCHDNKGVLLCILGRYAAALAEYEKAIILDPNDPITYSNKGRALGELNRYEEALAAYEQAQNIHQNSSPIKHNTQDQAP